MNTTGTRSTNRKWTPRALFDVLSRTLRPDEGQVVVLLVPILLMFMVAGVLVVDVGLFSSDRRDAQGDADHAALAGAIALTLDPSQTKTAAEVAADQYLILNDYLNDDPTATKSVVVSKDCYSANDGAFDKVAVDIIRKPKMTGFLGYFGASWTGGAKATACVGRPLTSNEFFPFALSADSTCFDQTKTPPAPILGATCLIRVDNTGSVTGTYGALDISHSGPSCSDKGSGANDLQDNIKTGAAVECAVYPGTGPGIPYDFVYSKQGNSVGPISAGLACRLKGTAGCLPVATCDAAHQITAADADSAALPTPHYRPPLNGIDDLFEIWERDPSQPVGSVKNVVANDCNTAVDGTQTSPRNITLVVVYHSLAPDGTTCGGGNNSYCVRGFERAYLEGCFDKDNVFTSLCDPLPGSVFTVIVRFVQQIASPTGNIGKAAYGDIAIQLVR